MHDFLMKVRQKNRNVEFRVLLGLFRVDVFKKVVMPIYTTSPLMKILISKAI